MSDGLDLERLRSALDGADAWGKLVHSFEYLDALGRLTDTPPGTIYRLDRNRLTIELDPRDANEIRRIAKKTTPSVVDPIGYREQSLRAIVVLVEPEIEE